MMNSIRLRLMLLLQFFATAVLAQNGGEFYNVIEPSPTAASLGTYANTKISSYTGTMGISVPLYTVRNGLLQVPVSLSYAGTGVKITDNASWVGHNWSLNAGGTIARTVRGLPDDLSGGYLTNPNQLLTAYNNPSVSELTGFVDARFDATKDGLPDLFFLNAAGLKATFFFDENEEIVLQSEADLKITEFFDAQNQLNKFEVVDANGVTYIFDVVEVTTPFSATNSNYDQTYYQNNYPSVYFSWNDTETKEDFNSAWQLSKIVGVDGREITFSYETMGEAYMTGESYTFRNHGTNVIQHNNLAIVATQKLSSISWNGNTVEFTASFNRTDILANTNTADAPQALTKVVVKDYNGEFVKGYQLSYSYFQEETLNGIPNDWDFLKHRLRLDAVQEIGNEQGTLTLPATSFEYDNTPLPPKMSAERDFLGYFNNNGALLLKPKLYFYPNENVQAAPYFSLYSIFPRNTYTGSQVVMGSVDRSPDLTYAQAGMLTKVEYPTGGSESFEYELDEFFFDGQTRSIGGLRIKKTTLSESTTATNNIVTEYLYEEGANPGQSSGKVVELPSFGSKAHNLYFADINLWNNADWETRSNVHSLPTGGLVSTNGSAIGYKEVTIQQQGNGKTVQHFAMPALAEDTTAGCDQGSCAYERVFAEDIPLNGTLIWDNFPFPSQPNYDHMRGLLVKSEVYNEQGQLKSKSEYEYSLKNFSKVKTLNVGITLTDAGGNPTSFLIARGYLLSSWNVLSKSTTTTYDDHSPANERVSTIDYNFDATNHHFITSVETSDNKGGARIFKYKYPSDYSGTATDEVGSAIVKMRDDLHMLGVQLEAIEIRKDAAGNEKVVSASFNGFSDFDPSSVNKVYPSISYKSNLSSAKSTSTWLESSLSSGTLQLDPSYQVEGRVLTYDSNGNPVEVQREHDVINSVVYGYQGLQPIASVANATSQEVAYTGFESDDQDNWVLNSSNQNSADAVAGDHSRQIQAGATNYGPTQIITPTDQNGSFVFSCWVKTQAGFGAQGGHLVINTMNHSSNATYPANTATGSYKTISFGDTNGEWQLLEVEIDLDEIRQNGNLQVNEILRVGVYVYNTDPISFFLVDDMKLHPTDAMMSTASYSLLQGVSSAASPNGQTSHYQFDEFGRLVLTQNHQREVLQSIQYHFKNQ